MGQGRMGEGRGSIRVERGLKVKIFLRRLGGSGCEILVTQCLSYSRIKVCVRVCSRLKRGHDICAISALGKKNVGSEQSGVTCGRFLHLNNGV